MLFVLWIVQLACVALWLPPVQEQLSAFPVLEAAPYYALPFSVASLFFAGALRVNKEEPSHAVKRAHGAGIGLFFSYLAQTVAHATGVDLGSVAVDAMDFAGEGSALFWRAGFMIGMPAVMGIFLDDTAESIGGALLRPVRSLPALVQAAGAAALGILLGGGLFFFLWSETTAGYVTQLDELYWSTLGETGGILLPIGVGLLVLMIGKIIPDRSAKDED